MKTLKTKTLNREEILTYYLGEEVDNTEDYLILTDQEALAQCKDSIVTSLWAFKTGFLANHLKDGTMDQREEKLRAIQRKFDKGNSAIINLVEDIDVLVDNVIEIDGRGNFLAMYDGEENEVDFDGETYYIYRTN